MKKRSVIVKINCGKKRCNSCIGLSLDEEYCEIFNQKLKDDGKWSSSRLKRCLKSEKKLKKIIKKQNINKVINLYKRSEKSLKC